MRPPRIADTRFTNTGQVGPLCLSPAHIICFFQNFSMLLLFKFIWRLILYHELPGYCGCEWKACLDEVRRPPLQWSFHSRM